METKSTKTKRSFSHYHITNLDGTYVYTGLGKFESVASAMDKWRSQPRNGRASIYAVYDVKRLGIVYGIEVNYVQSFGALA